jgi:hypothetical protein
MSRGGRQSGRHMWLDGQIDEVHTRLPCSRAGYKRRGAGRSLASGRGVWQGLHERSWGLWWTGGGTRSLTGHAFDEPPHAVHAAESGAVRTRARGPPWQEHRGGLAAAQSQMQNSSPELQKLHRLSVAKLGIPCERYSPGPPPKNIASISAWPPIHLPSSICLLVLAVHSILPVSLSEIRMPELSVAFVPGASVHASKDSCRSE